MAFIAQLVKVLGTLAALITSMETIIRISKFAWGLVLELVRKQEAAGKAFRFQMPKFRFGSR